MTKKHGAKSPLYTRIGATVAVAAAAAAPAMADTTGVTPDPTIFAPAVTTTQTYLSALVATHGLNFLEISMIPIGLFFVWHLMRRAFSA
jgi:hypothetical protein